ncbi:MAG: arsenic efflux protein [Eggerthellaceae bacterium]|nr:arsenic efflux protein [Eggerthellaceae bacterium]
MEFVLDILLDALKDTAILIPFLFATYVLMEWLEHRTGEKTQKAVLRAGVAGPAVGALLGAVPQCGFSAASSTLYAGRVITLGTLFAVYLATSDEMLPIFIAQQVPIETILGVLGIKVVVGMVVGFIVDLVLRLTHHVPEKLKIHELCAKDNCHCSGDCDTCERYPELVYEHFKEVVERAEHGGESEHHHDHSHDRDARHSWADILKSSLIHTGQVVLYVFLITIVLNAVIGLIGEETLGTWMSGNEYLSVMMASLFGLIPNCAASVAIAQLYLEGVLGFGAMMGGLLSAAGIGLLVLFRNNRNLKQNLAIIGILFAVSAAIGCLFVLFNVAL